METDKLSDRQSSPLVDQPGSLDRLSQKARWTWIKRLVSVVLLAALIYFFMPLAGEIRGALALFKIARWEWLAAAVSFQVISYGFLTWLNALALQPFPGKIGFFKLAGLLTSMAFIQTAVPSAGASGIALRVRLLSKAGYTPESSLFSLAVETIAELIALASFAFLGLVFLIYSGRLDMNAVVWMVIAAASTIGLMFLGWRILLDPPRARRLLRFLVSSWNRFFERRRPLHYDVLEKRLGAFQDNLRCYRQVPFWKFVAAAYGKVVFDIATLGACFFMFLYAIKPEVLTTGYGIMLTMSGISALPGGLGMTDAYVPVIFSWFSTPGSIALAAGLTYRLIAFWLVRFVGYFSWGALEAQPKSS